MAEQHRPAWWRREFTVFLITGLLSLAIVGIGTGLISRNIAHDEAIRHAERLTNRLANLVIGPLLADTLAGVDISQEALDRVVENRLQDSSILRINVWAENGQVLYSSDSSTIGKVFEPSEAILAAIRDEKVSAEAIEQGHAGFLVEEKVIEIYVPLRVEGLPPLAFEGYYDYEPVDDEIDRLVWTLVPLSVGALLLLQAVQLPMALRLTRRIHRHERQRTRLLHAAVEASEIERRRIAADLHDGVIQDLAGVGYALGAIARTPDTPRETLGDLTGVLTRSIESLRRLMVDIYPEDLSAESLPSALSDLAEPLRQNGVAVDLQVTALPPLDQDVTDQIYRTAREALRNVLAHSSARAVRISLGADGLRRSATVALRIDDDGVGISEPAADGHLGLRLLARRAAELGGEFTASNRPEGGARVELLLQAHRELPE